MKDDWTTLKKTFTKTQEDALWQYFIDHSRIQPNGYLGILFYVKNVDDFWRRLFYRSFGEYIRYDIEEKERYQDEQIARFLKYKKRINETRVNKLLFIVYTRLHKHLFGTGKR